MTELWVDFDLGAKRKHVPITAAALDNQLKQQGYRLVRADRVRDICAEKFVHEYDLAHALRREDFVQLQRARLFSHVAETAAAQGAVFSNEVRTLGDLPGRRFAATMRIILPKPE